MTDAVEQLLTFTARLRAAGLTTTVDRDERFVEAVSRLGVERRTDVFWAGRATLCAGPDDIALYDACFAECFGRTGPLTTEVEPTTVRQATLDRDEDVGSEGERTPTLAPSEAETLRQRDVADLSDAERAWLRQLFGDLLVRQPVRRGRRHRRARRGDVDRAATVRAALRRGGEVAVVRRHRPAPRPVRIVLVIDVSGSMAPYADAFLRLGHRLVASLEDVEVFTVGTRLTRVTVPLRARDPDVALERVGVHVADWSGGTRLGEALGTFNREWGRRGVARRSVVLVASDGLERGDPRVLVEEVQTLVRLARSVLWVSPLPGRPDYEPVQTGIAAVLPHVDGLLAGHSLAALQDVLDAVAAA